MSLQSEMPPQNAVQFPSSSYSDKPPPYAAQTSNISSYGIAIPMTNLQVQVYNYDVLLIYDPESDYYDAQV